ncbi:MAG: hypothetical protein ACLPYS_17425 [Vulcanimicrobiaceae bacterium]
MKATGAAFSLAKEAAIGTGPAAVIGPRSAYTGTPTAKSASTSR